jgi:hypothetical protein
MPTAFSVGSLADQLRLGDEDRVVWLAAGAAATARGRVIDPLYPSAPLAAAEDPKLHELLALADTLRIGRARERALATTLGAYYAFVERLRSLGFNACTDEGAPLCRLVVSGIRVDVMGSADTALGPTNRWYAEAIAGAQAHALAPRPRGPRDLAHLFRRHEARGIPLPRAR